jgi:hypothetical protein
VVPTYITENSLHSLVQNFLPSDAITENFPLAVLHVKLNEGTFSVTSAAVSLYDRKQPLTKSKQASIKLAFI